ncbi:hypothetical protein FQN60_017902 [Etheostoma spectabile]|uniref:Uncharacterized protein n=1 Tax=Etheostoma spectabile TaxID=54343 RepID=A0A5J5DGI3_9PERO|nr:hypothetical protein FQN60_017902 [Etheostoma spectabile]
MAVNRRPPFPLTGGFVRSVMVRVQLLFTHFCRRGRHVFASWGELKFSVQKPTTCCCPHNVAADERGSHSNRRSRAPFNTNAPRRMEKRRAPPLKEHVVMQQPMPSPEQAISTVRIAAAAVVLAPERNSAIPLQKETH